MHCRSNHFLSNSANPRCRPSKSVIYVDAVHITTNTRQADPVVVTAVDYLYKVTSVDFKRQSL